MSRSDFGEPLGAGPQGAGGADPQGLMELLEERYPTLYQSVVEVGEDPDGSTVAQWVNHAREVVDIYVAEQKSRRKVEEAIAVKESYELAAALVVAIAGKG